MVNTLILFSSLGTTFSLVGIAVFYVCMLLRRTGITASASTDHILSLLAQARRFSVLLAIMSLVTSTFLPWADCLSGYSAVGALCKELSEDWLLASLLLLLSGLILNFLPLQDQERSAIRSMPVSCLQYGLTFLLFSVLLSGL